MLENKNILKKIKRYSPLLLLILPIWGPITSIIFGFKDHVITLYFDKLGFLWIISLYLQIIFYYYMKKETRNIFFDEQIPFPRPFNHRISKYYDAIFDPGKARKKNYPEEFYFFKKKIFGFKINIKFLNYKFVAIIFGLIIGLISFITSYSFDELETNFIETLIVGGFSVATVWFIVISISWIMIGIILILDKLYRNVKDLRDYGQLKVSWVTIKKFEKIKKIPIIIILGYACFMITFPAFFILTIEGLSILGSIFNIFIGIIGLLIVLIIPSYYVYSILDMMKTTLKKDYYKKIDKLDNNIRSDCWIDEDLKVIEYLHRQTDDIERIHLLPTDSFSMIRIFLSAILGNCYYIFIIFKSALEMK